VDIIFKLLFGDERNKDLTINFISAVLGYKDGELEDRIEGARKDGIKEVLTLLQSGLSLEDVQKKLGV